MALPRSIRTIFTQAVKDAKANPGWFADWTKEKIVEYAISTRDLTDVQLLEKVYRDLDRLDDCSYRVVASAETGLTYALEGTLLKGLCDYFMDLRALPDSDRYEKPSVTLLTRELCHHYGIDEAKKADAIRKVKEGLLAKDPYSVPSRLDNDQAMRRFMVAMLHQKAYGGSFSVSRRAKAE